MKLVSFSVENFRSITNARKIILSDYSLLIGPNNEGKSNVLQALAVAMNALIDWQRSVALTADGRLVRQNTILTRHQYGRFSYDWHTDFPVSKQSIRTKQLLSNILLEFSLEDKEVVEFNSEIGSNLNGTLPILVSFGRENFAVSVKKQGRGHVTLNKKSNRIANFISKRIRFEYIPAIRTAESASSVISDLVERELSQLEGNQEYIDALGKIEEIQRPVLQSLSETIKETIAHFVPSISSVQLNIGREWRSRALRRNIEIDIDDGNLTPLERKGDGVKSLVALALMRHASEQSSTSLSTIIAIEEPESHLHPKAIHELRSVIEKLSENNQVVLSSHSPLFVKPDSVQSTIIVQSNKAKSADNLAEIREILGVKFSDNLQNAKLVIIVEGMEDVRSLRAIIANSYPNVEKYVKDGVVAIDDLGGVISLRQKASFYKNNACIVKCFLDSDQEAKNAVNKVIDDKILDISDITFCSVPHLQEAEIEDIYDKNVYQQAFYDEFGVDPKHQPKNKKSCKWSDSMELIFKDVGKPWNNRVKSQIKGWMCEFVINNTGTIINVNLDSPLKNFLINVEKVIPDS